MTITNIAINQKINNRLNGATEGLLGLFKTIVRHKI